MSYRRHLASEQLKPIFRRPKAEEDVEQHAMYFADGSIDAALRFLERTEQTIKGLASFPASGAPFPSRLPELKGLRTKLVKDLPNHVVFYIEPKKRSRLFEYYAAVRIWASKLRKTSDRQRNVSTTPP